MQKAKNRKTKTIYFDYAASAEANPSSIHLDGVRAKTKLQNSRKEVAGVLGARPEGIIFTSGGTESNNLAIQGVVFAWHEKNKQKVLPHIITINIEHLSVLKTCKLLEEKGLAEITIIPVETNGIVDPRKIKQAIKKNTVLISVMYANNEIGTIQPIREIAKGIRHYRKTKQTIFPFFHTDAVQAANYLDLSVEKLGVDLLSLSGSKIQGAGKIGVLYKKKSTLLTNIFSGGDQEFSLRPGTENLPEILKFSKALKSVQAKKEKETKRLTKLRDHFITSLRKNFIFSGPRFPGVPTPARPFKKESFATPTINGDLEKRLPNNVNITIQNIPSDLLVIELSAKGIMASSKSACKSSDAEGSYVIKAIRPKADSEIGGLRFSLGGDTTKRDIDFTIKSLIQIINKLKKWYN